MIVETKNLRNVVLLGHPGSGKTSLAETMLYESKAISRHGDVESGTTVSDFTNIEKERKNSIFSSMMHDKWKDSKINIIDTPGFDDFVGEVISSLKVADTAAMILNAKSGVEVGTEILWDYIDQLQTPTMFVVNQVDSEKSNFQQTLEQAQARFGNKVLPVQYPLNEGAGFNKIVDALRMVMYVFPEGGGKPTKEEIPDSEKDKAMDMHNALVEAAAENEEGLMEKFFEEGTLSEDDLAAGLRIAMVNHEIYPVFCVSAIKNMGTGRVMGFINDICPSPADRPPAKLEDGGELVCDDKDKTTIFIFKTMSEPKVGNVSYFKVYSGRLNAGAELVNADTGATERFGQIFVVNGRDRDAVEGLNAGDIGATVKLKNTHTNNTLNEKGVNRKIEKMHFPEPRVRQAVVAGGKNEVEKMMKGVHQIEEEDPTLKVEQSAALKQTILHGQGQLHLDLVKYRLEKVYNVNMDFVKPKIAYRETITKMAETSYRHKKQSGGSGQFAEVHMRIEPYHEGMPDPASLTVRDKEIIDLPWEGKLAFYWCIVGGSIDSKYKNAIKKGIMQKMEEGILTGSYIQDVRVSIYDGKMHSVDSNDMAFMIASGTGFKQAFNQAGPQILEPIYDLEILCADDVMGDVMGDLQTRRAIIQGMDSDGHYQKIMAKVPHAELYQYSSTLRSLTQGKAKFSRKFAEYSAVPHDIQKKLIEEQNEE